MSGKLRIWIPQRTLEGLSEGHADTSVEEARRSPRSTQVGLNVFQLGSNRLCIHCGYAANRTCEFRPAMSGRRPAITGQDLSTSNRLPLEASLILLWIDVLWLCYVRNAE